MCIARCVTLAAAVALFGCGNTVPTSPAPPVPPTSPAPIPFPPAVPTGTIAPLSIEPPSGATVLVRECTATSGYRWFCADEPRMIFDVVIDRDVPDAILTVGFYDGLNWCGSAYSGPGVNLTAGQTAAVSTTRLDFSDEERPLACNLPQTTRKLRVQLWSRGGGALLTREFDGTYSFSLKP